MDTLSLELQLQIFDFLDISSLLNVADTCRAWRNAVTNVRFVEKQCRRRFDLSLDQLPPLAPCEELLINTQRLVFQGSDPVFLDGDESLMKTYAMEMRASWYPFAFLESCVGENAPLRQLKYPWPYDSGAQYGEESAFFRDTKKLSARIHAAFPYLFESLVCRALDEEGYPLKLSYYTSDYSALDPLIPRINALINPTPASNPRVIELRSSGGPALCLFIYGDDNTWSALLMYEYNTPVAGAGTYLGLDSMVAFNSPLQAIRASSAEYLMRCFCQDIGRNDHTLPMDTCPPYLALEPTRADCHSFQMKLMEALSSIITAAAYDLGKKLFSVDADPAQREQMFWKLTRFIDDLYPCADVHHSDCKSQRKAPSKRLNIALSRALRRLVSGTYMEEVKRLYGDPITCQMVHSWSWSGKGRGGNNGVCFDSKRPPEFDKRKCYMKVAVASSCCRCAFPSVWWPAVTLKKAIDEMPHLMKALEEEAIGYVSQCTSC